MTDTRAKEIREKWLSKFGLSVSRDKLIGKKIDESAIGAMQDYAQEQAIAFKSWCDKNDFVKLEEAGNDQFKQHEGKYFDQKLSPYQMKFYNTADLYSIFLQETEGKKETK